MFRRHPNIAARKGSIPNSSRAWKSSSASTSRRYERFGMMMWNYLRFDFGESYFRDTSVLDSDQRDECRSRFRSGCG